MGHECSFTISNKKFTTRKMGSRFDLGSINYHSALTKPVWFLVLEVGTCRSVQLRMGTGQSLTQIQVRWRMA